MRKGSHRASLAPCMKYSNVQQSRWNTGCNFSCDETDEEPDYMGIFTTGLGFQLSYLKWKYFRLYESYCWNFLSRTNLLSGAENVLVLQLCKCIQCKTPDIKWWLDLTKRINVSSLVVPGFLRFQPCGEFQSRAEHFPINQQEQFTSCSPEKGPEFHLW